MKLGISSILSASTKAMIVKKIPEISVASGIFGFWTSMGITHVCTKKGIDKLNEAEEKKGSPLTTEEKFKIVAPYVVLPAVGGAVSSVAIIGGLNLKNKQNMALAATCAMAEKSLADYKSVTKEEVGAKKSQKVDDAYAKKVYSESTNFFEDTGTGNYPFLDVFTGKKFFSSASKIKEAAATMSLDIFAYDGIPARSFYDELNLDAGTFTDNVGWNTCDGRIEVSISYPGETYNDLPIGYIRFKVDPHSDYDSLPFN